MDPILAILMAAFTFLVGLFVGSQYCGHHIDDAGEKGDDTPV